MSGSWSTAFPVTGPASSPSTIASRSARCPLGLLAGYSANSPSLVVDTLLDPLIARRNRFALAWDGCWELHAPPVPEDPWPLQITVTFDDPVPVRPERLIAHGLGISRRRSLTE
ncbi:DUF1062 domain-containing protein [Streptosporangium lutulentum]